MPSTPLISVVIPTYNQPALLAETLASVFAQTLRDFEVVIINDGSTDDTLRRLEVFIQCHGERLRVITQANAGIGPARDRGIDESRGKFVALLDHDDLWMPRKLQAQAELFERHPRLVSAGVVWAGSSTPTTPAFNLAALGAVDGVIERPWRIAAEGHNFFLTSTLMFDRVKASGLRHGTVRGIMEDVQFHIGLFARGAFGIADSDILAIYRVHASNFSRNADFYAGGIRQLRRMDGEGAFREVTPADRPLFLKYMAGLGRGAAVKDLICGNRRRGIQTYLLEFAHQWGQRRLDFLLAFPALAVIPSSIVDAWSNRAVRRAVRRARKREARVATSGDDESGSTR